MAIANKRRNETVNETSLLKLIFGEDFDCHSNVTVSSNVFEIFNSLDNDKQPSCPVLDFMKTIRYNGFIGKNVVEQLLVNIAKREITGFRFGREYSCVLYITVPSMNWIEKRPYQPGELDKLVAKLKADYKALNAQEIDLDGHTIRVWWD